MSKFKRRTLRISGAVLDSVTERDGLMILDFRISDLTTKVEKHAIIECRPSALYGYAREIGRAIERRAQKARADVESVERGFHHGREAGAKP